MKTAQTRSIARTVRPLPAFDDMHEDYASDYEPGRFDARKLDDSERSAHAFDAFSIGIDSLAF